jgi:hypothetical protein
MTICMALANRGWVKATAIVATSHPERALLIVKLYGDLRRGRVAKGIRQSFSGNAKDFIRDMALKSIASSSAFECEIDCRGAVEIGCNALD